MPVKFRDPVNGFTHLGGALLSIWAIFLLVGCAVEKGGAWNVASFAVFGASLFALYTASTLYHLLPLSEEGVRKLRRLDHIGIFVLIAGTFTPFCLGPLRGGVGWALFAGIWAFAALGAVFKVLWMHAPRWLSTLIYVAMAALSLFAIGPLTERLPHAGVVWLVAGGVCYGVGALIYAFKWPDPFPRVLGFHEIWHLFVIGGSFCHFWAVWRHVAAA